MVVVKEEFDEEEGGKEVKVGQKGEMEEENFCFLDMWV